MIPLVILVIVFMLIAVRQVGNIRLRIWQIMLCGAIAVLVTGQISPLDAFRSIDLNVMLFLFGAFVVGQALEESGYLSHLSYRLLRRVKTIDGLVLAILFGMGALSALLMNDTLAIIGTPVVLALARRHGMQTKMLLLALAFAVTIGSVMSPIGNPQNLLIAIGGGIANPFVTFIKYLAAPTILNLFVAYFILKLYYRKQFHDRPLVHEPEAVNDRSLANLSKVSLGIMLVLVAAKIVTVFAGLNVDFHLTYIAVAAALPVIVFSPKRLHVIRSVDWHTLVFFAAMFILMRSAWDSDVFQNAIASSGLSLDSTNVILSASVLLSQFISNVPLVALYLPILSKLGATTHTMMALAAGSTIAGNLSILGAASNVIIIQNAEKKTGDTLTFWDFIRIGVPLTVINVLVYWVFLMIMP